VRCVIFVYYLIKSENEIENIAECILYTNTFMSFIFVLWFSVVYVLSEKRIST